MLVWSLVQPQGGELGAAGVSLGALAAVALELSLGLPEDDVSGSPAAPQSALRAPRLVMAASVGGAGSSGELVGDQEPLFGHFYPSGLGMVVAKVTVLSLTARLQAVQKRIDEIEEEDAEAILQIELADVLAPSRHKHELSLWKGFGRDLRIGVIRGLAIVSVQRVFELIAIRWCVSRKMAKSLVKNCPRSAVRKAARYSYASRSALVSKVATSAFKGQFMFWLALFTVNQAVDTWVTFVDSGKKSEAVDAPQSSHSYTQRLVINALRCGGGCALAAVGAAVGTALRPGLGTTLGMNIAPQFVYFLI